MHSDSQDPQIDPVCNICGGTRFLDVKQRPAQRCSSCKSRVRHRIAYEIYRRNGLLDGKTSPPCGLRVLHLAPERHLHDRLRPAIGAGYVCADAVPDAYPWAQCLKLFLPGDMQIFPAGYFDFVIHNHVMEHIPGHFRDHFPDFCRVLKPGGKLIFSIPGPNMDILTEEGGEFLENDEARKARFGQYNHLRRFGRDLPEFLAALEGGSFAWDDLSSDDRRAIGAGSRGSRFMLWTRDAGTDAARPEGTDAGGTAAASRDVPDATRTGIRRVKRK